MSLDGLGISDLFVDKSTWLLKVRSICAWHLSLMVPRDTTSRTSVGQLSFQLL
jgi:hypothetical protein